MESKIEAVALVRYARCDDGIRLLQPQDDGYWTPWHVAQQTVDALIAERDALQIEVMGLTAQNERFTAYMVTHKGAGLYCSDSMRQAYSDQTVQAERAEAEAAGLREALLNVLPYAEHSDECGDMDAYNNASVPRCGCGLDSIKEAAGKAIDAARKELADAR